jgi:hypothetical protein
LAQNSKGCGGEIKLKDPPLNSDDIRLRDVGLHHVDDWGIGERYRTVRLRRSSRASEYDDQNEKTHVLEQWCTFALDIQMDTADLPAL